MAAIYQKPYFRELFKVASKREEAGVVYYPYGPEFFKQYEVFPLFIHDGGAFFFITEHIGGASASDYLVALDSSKLFEPWMVDGKLEWDKAYDDAVAEGRKIEGEKNVWLNRLYFLLPLAWRFFRTGEEKWAKRWLEYLKDWSAAHPRPVGAPWLAHGKHFWSDMQVAWRLLVIMHSIFLLGKSTALTREDWRFVYAALLEHSNHVYEEAVEGLKGSGRGNHFLQKGSALIQVGTLFPELPLVQDYVEVGRGVLRDQMRKEIYPDGGSIEASPSYSHFIARLYLDAHLCLEANHHPPIRGLKSCIQRQYEFLRDTASPTGLSLPLSDAYHLDARQDLEIVARLFPVSTHKSTVSQVFKDSNFAVLRSKRVTIYLDGMPLGLWHHHQGKPNLLVYLDGQPVMVDSGCCNYDLAAHKGWFGTAPAHNVVLVEPLAGKIVSTQDNVPKISLDNFRASPERSEVTMTHRYDSPEVNYVWKRTVILSEDVLELHDTVRSSKDARCTLVFHFAPARMRVSNEGKQITVSNDNWKLVMRDQREGADVRVTRSKKPAFDEANRPYQAPMLLLTRTGTQVEFKYRCDFA